MNEGFLFDVPEKLSPRLEREAAIDIEILDARAKYGILTHFSGSMPKEIAWIALCPVKDDMDKDISTIMAESCRLYDESDLLGYGPTERDAILDLLPRIPN